MRFYELPQNEATCSKRIVKILLSTTEPSVSKNQENNGGHSQVP